MTEFCSAAGAEKILLATDGSEYSEGAVREAIRLAKKCSSPLSVVTVMDFNPEFDTVAPKITEKIEKDAWEHLCTVKARALQEKIDCDTLVHKGGDPCKKIVDVAAKNKSTMIVMGRRGRTGLKRVMMGSVSVWVIGHAPCNVFVVPKAAELSFKSILVATDGSKYSMAAASEAIRLARRNGSYLTVISVVPSELATPADIVSTVHKHEFMAEKEMRQAENIVKAVKESAQKEGVSVKAFVVSGKPALAIVETAKDRNADLIVVGNHARTGIKKLLMGSVAERVIVLSSCPVLVVKAGA